MTRSPALLVLLSLGIASPCAAEPTSPWAIDGPAALRLVDAGAGPAPDTRLAAIAIRLDRGWKTYWRQPGASGVPPRFDFSGSSNLAEASVAFPAPERQADGDGVVNVYHDAVTLPVTVRPRDPSTPVTLKLVADYGVCEAVCVPMRSETTLELGTSGGRDGPAAADVRRAETKTPRPTRLGARAPLAVETVTRVSGPDGAAALDIEVAVPEEGGAPTLFAETGAGDYAPAPEPIGAPEKGKARFRMTFEERDLPASGVKLTLAAGDAAIETAVALDAVGGKP